MQNQLNSFGNNQGRQANVNFVVLKIETTAFHFRKGTNGGRKRMFLQELICITQNTCSIHQIGFKLNRNNGKPNTYGKYNNLKIALFNAL